MRQALLLRDALGELARVFFDRPEPVPIMTRWVPSMTPALLEGAARFGGGEDEALVSVFITANLLDQDEIAQVSDWSRGRLLEVPPGAEVRTSMSGVSYRCAVLLGGDDEVGKDADIQLQIARQAHGAAVFAIGSTGGEADKRYKANPDDFGGKEPELELAAPTSYTLLMKRILAASQSGPKRHQTSGPGGGGPSGSHGRASNALATESKTQVRKVVVRARRHG